MSGFQIKWPKLPMTTPSTSSIQPYLRSTDYSKTSRGLAKRAAASESGLDFDSIARYEVIEIAKHFHELAEIDDSNHQSSSYSMETTLEGIRAVAALIDEQNFEDISANEILLLLNILGMACEGPVGDFPDPMTWRVNQIYPGVFVSVADLLTSRIRSQNQSNYLAVPGHEESIITNVIPVFKDERIAKFLKTHTHAPNLLSYTCSSIYGLKLRFTCFFDNKMKFTFF